MTQPQINPSLIGSETNEIPEWIHPTTGGRSHLSEVEPGLYHVSRELMYQMMRDAGHVPLHELHGEVEDRRLCQPGPDEETVEDLRAFQPDPEDQP